MWVARCSAVLMVAPKVWADFNNPVPTGLKKFTDYSNSGVNINRKDLHELSVEADTRSPGSGPNQKLDFEEVIKSIENEEDMNELLEKFPVNEREETEPILMLVEACLQQENRELMLAVVKAFYNWEYPVEIAKPIRSTKFKKLLPDNDEAKPVVEAVERLNTKVLLEFLNVISSVMNEKKLMVKEYTGEPPSEDEVSQENQEVPSEDEASQENQVFKKVDWMAVKAKKAASQIELILHALCAKVATMIKGKSPEEIKNILSFKTAASDSSQK